MFRELWINPTRYSILPPYRGNWNVRHYSVSSRTRSKQNLYILKNTLVHALLKTIWFLAKVGLAWWLGWQRICLQCGGSGFNPWVGKRWVKWKLPQPGLISLRVDCNPRGSSVHGILQARILEWVAVPFSRGSSQPRDRTYVSHTAGGFFTVLPHILPWLATREAPRKGRDA